MTPNRPQDPVSGCEGKKAFISYDAAAAVVGRPHKIKGKRQAYHCSICRQWHIGRPNRPKGRRS